MTVLNQDMEFKMVKFNLKPKSIILRLFVICTAVY